MTGQRTTGSSRVEGADVERLLGRALTAGTYVAIAFVAIGVVALLIGGRSPLDVGAAPFDLEALPGQLAAGRPEGFLWLGLVVAIATPVGRVAGALLGFVARGERFFATVAVAILGVIAVAVVLGLRSG